MIALRNKKIAQIFNLNTSPYFRRASRGTFGIICSATCRNVTPNCSYTVTLELGFFASAEMQCAALGFPYAVNLEMDDSLKWVLFNVKKKRSAWLLHRLLASIIVLNYGCQGTVWSPARYSLQRKQGFFVFFVFDLDFSKALTNLIMCYPTVKA